MFLLVPAYPGCPGSKAVKRSLLLLLLLYLLLAFSALTLLVWGQEERPACKNCVMGCCCGYLPGARCRLFVYGPADATAITKPPSSLASFESRLFLPFWYRLTQVVLEKRPLNGRSSSCCCTYYMPLTEIGGFPYSFSYHYQPYRWL